MNLRGSWLVLVVVTALAACGVGDDGVVARSSTSTSVPVHRSTAPPPSPTTSVVTTTGRPPPAPSPSSPPALEVALRIERRTTDGATAGFVDTVRRVLTDPRSWSASGFEFRFADDAPYTVVLAEPAEVDQLCAPYDTASTYSCQNGPVVAINATRWRAATTSWTATLEAYREMVVNHEVGHLLGLHHPVSRCPEPGHPAPVMAQQTIGLEGCLPNPWPLPWELACARRHEETLAPGYEPDATPRCGPDDL